MFADEPIVYVNDNVEYGKLKKKYSFWGSSIEVLFDN